MMICKICGSDKVNLQYKDYPGYVVGDNYDIYNCLRCNTNFVEFSKIDQKIYDLIYSNTKIEGYERYLNISKEIKNKQNPLEFLGNQEIPYNSVYDFIKKKKKKLKILEIGSGYGYLTYALKSSGHDVLGIDISSVAVECAKKNFGDYYLNINLADFIKKKENLYDLIIATEVIEHIPAPFKFLRDCQKLLKSNGSLILTTPNKDFYRKKTVWASDSPPVHLYLFSHQSFKLISEMLGFNYQFINYSSFEYKKSNQIINYIFTRKIKNLQPKLNSDGTIVSKDGKYQSKFRNNINNFMLKNKIIRCLTRILYKPWPHSTLGIILTLSDRKL